MNERIAALLKSFDGLYRVSQVLERRTGQCVEAVALLGAIAPALGVTPAELLPTGVYGLLVDAAALEEEALAGWEAQRQEDQAWRDQCAFERQHAAGKV